MADERQMLELLTLVQAGDDANELVDNAIIAKRLGWSLEDVAACLQDAKERSLVWGNRTGDKPMPWFKELEVTVQGRRLLKAEAGKAASGKPPQPK